MLKAKEIKINIKVDEHWQTKIYHVDEEIWGERLSETYDKPELTTEVLTEIVQAADDNDDESVILYAILWDQNE